MLETVKEGWKKAKKLEKQEKLTKSWELVRECRKIIKENYSSWQERKTTEEENKKLQELELEKLSRLEKVKQEKYRTSRELQNEEEAMRKRLILAEIKENAWKRRGEMSIHEVHSDRLEKEEKNEKKDPTTVARQNE